MADKQIIKQQQRILRKKRVRAKVSGTPAMPRLSVNRSLRNIFVQIIDDVNGKTLASARNTEIKTKGNKTDIATQVGELIAQKAVKAGITKVVFDKGSAKYHGRVKAVADGARKGGLKF